MVAITGTSDQPRWLAEACKNLLLLHVPQLACGKLSIPGGRQMHTV